MLARLDREIVGVPGLQILECKTTGEFGARLWRAGVPEYVQLQVQHRLAVTGKRAADVAVLLCGQQLAVHRIERDDELIARLIPLEAQFWQYVIDDTPPSADGSESADRALRCLFPGNARVVDIGLTLRGIRHVQDEPGGRTVLVIPPAKERRRGGSSCSVKRVKGWMTGA